MTTILTFKTRVSQAKIQVALKATKRIYPRCYLTDDSLNIVHKISDGKVFCNRKLKVRTK